MRAPGRPLPLRSRRVPALGGRTFGESRRSSFCMPDLRSLYHPYVMGDATVRDPTTCGPVPSRMEERTQTTCAVWDPHIFYGLCMCWSFARPRRTQTSTMPPDSTRPTTGVFCKGVGLRSLHTHTGTNVFSRNVLFNAKTLLLR